MPGGKIEVGEHVSEAIVREIMEETGLASTFKEHLGFVSEHLIENENIIPSDYLMIEKLFKERNKKYYNCVVEKQKNNYFLKKFK